MSKNNKWKGVMITEHNVDEYLSDLTDKKARHITQGVSFNKQDSQQMNLLRLALIRHGSFSGLVKYLLVEYFKNEPIDWDLHPLSEERVKENIQQREQQRKDLQQQRQELFTKPSPLIEETTSLETLAQVSADTAEENKVEEEKDNSIVVVEPPAQPPAKPPTRPKKEGKGVPSSFRKGRSK